MVYRYAVGIVLFLLAFPATAVLFGRTFCVPDGLVLPTIPDPVARDSPRGRVLAKAVGATAAVLAAIAAVDANASAAAVDAASSSASLSPAGRGAPSC
ncbi:hypothetical protein DFJ74DRAFT_685394 [Hyaloraphidium curvatum]|nr:hypothetical protein DFJ74DRAFT_685394 [Hyaloraphidium curvatum]